MGGGQREGQLGEEAGLQPASVGQWRGAIFLDAQAHLPQAQLVGQQLLQGQAPGGGVMALGEQPGVDLRRGMVQHAQAMVELGQGEALTQGLGQPFRQGLGGGVEARQGLVDQGPQSGLGQALGGRVDGGQVILHRRRALAQQPVFRVIELEAGGAGPGLAEGADPGSRAELLLLGRGEMEEAQAEDAGAVAQAHQQAATAPSDDLGGHDFSLPHRLVAGA